MDECPNNEIRGLPGGTHSYSRPTSASLNVTVAICTRDRPEYLERCLRSLQRLDRSKVFLLVVDNGSNQNSTQKMAERFGANYIIAPVRGLSRARNVGASASTNDIIAFIDDDMIASVDWLHALISGFVDEKVGAVTGPMLSVDLQDADAVTLQLATQLAPWGGINFQLDGSSHQWFERSNFGGVGDGNFAIRKSVFEKIGRFDERLGRGEVIDSCEEHYAFFKIIENGYKISYVSQAIVFHSSKCPTASYLQQQVATTVAFAAFLAWHHPKYFVRVIRFLIEGALGVHRWWHFSRSVTPTSLGLGVKIRSGLMGFRMFYASLKNTRSRGIALSNSDRRKRSGHKGG